MSDIQNPGAINTNYQNKVQYLDDAVKAAKNVDSSPAADVTSKTANVIDKIEPAHIERSATLLSSTVDSNMPQILKESNFSSEDSLKISNSMMQMVQNKAELEMKVLIALGSAFIVSGLIAERESETVVKAAALTQQFIKPLADLIKSEGLATAQETREQANQMMAQGIAGIAGSAVEVAGGIGSMMGTDPAEVGAKTSLTEEDEAAPKGEGDSSEDPDSEAESEETQTKAVYGSNEEGTTGNTDTRIGASHDGSSDEESSLSSASDELSGVSHEDEVSSSHRAEAAEALSTSKSTAKKTGEFMKDLKQKFLGFGKNTVKLLGAQNMVFGMALSRLITSSSKIYEATSQYNIADIQEKQAQTRADKQEMQMYSDLLSSNQSRLQNSVRSMEDLKDSLGSAIKDFNQSNSQSTRSIFG